MKEKKEKFLTFQLKLLEIVHLLLFLSPLLDSDDRYFTAPGHEFAKNTSLEASFCRSVAFKIVSRNQKRIMQP